MAKKLLYINASPKREIAKSRGRQIAEAYIEGFREVQPDIEVERLDLYFMHEDEFPQVDEDLIFARAGLRFRGLTMDDLTPEQQRKYKNHIACAEKFMSADYYLVASPVWNLGSPSLLKKYFDNVFISGKTFYAKAGERRGLLGGRNFQHVQTRGGIYSHGPLVDKEMGDRYVRTAADFLGLDPQPVIFAEGLDHFPKEIPNIVAKACEEAREAGRKAASK